MAGVSVFSRSDIRFLSTEIGKAVSKNSSNLTSGGSAKAGEIDIAAITNTITAAAQEKIDKKQGKTDKLTAQRDALNDLKSISSSISSAVQNIKSTGVAGGLFGTFAATGAPAGVTIAPSAGAKVGAHTMSVGSVASKQTVVIQSKDALGNAVAFARGAADVTSPAGALVAGTFIRNQTFNIYNNSNNNGAPIVITIPNAVTTLQGVADEINNAAGALLTATVVSDTTGDKLVLQSINAGVAGNFYIDDRDITGVDHAGVPGVAPTAISTLSVTPSYDDIKSIDVYSLYGSTFAGHNAFIANGDENASFHAVGVWQIGNGFINFAGADITSLDKIARLINASQAVTGVTASVVSPTGGGYILRLTALNGTQLKYNPDSTLDIFAAPATATRIRPSTGTDGMVTIDGATFNTGGTSTVTKPTPDIASITFTTPTPTTTFSITQDVAALTDAIGALVDNINEAQQFIYQQREEEAPLLSNNTLNQLSSLISSIVGSNTNTISLSQMGISWTDFTPTSAQKRDGMVPARVLSINAAALNAKITSNFDDVKGFFCGTFGNAEKIGVSKASVSSMSKIMTMANFDLSVTCTDPVGHTFTATDVSGLPGLFNPPFWLGGNKLLITGVAGSKYDGLSINYTYTNAAGLNVLNATDTIAGISVYNGASLRLSKSLESYLGPYGSLDNEIKAKNKNIENSLKDTKRIYEKRDKQIAKAKAAAQKIAIQKTLMEALRKSLFGDNKN